MDELSPTESAASGGPASVDQPAGAADVQSDLDGGNETGTQTTPASRRRSAPQFAPDHDLHLSDSGDESMAEDRDMPQQQQPQNQQTGGGTQRSPSPSLASDSDGEDIEWLSDTEAQPSTSIRESIVIVKIGLC